MPREIIEIGPTAWWRLALCSVGGKKRNKSLLTALSGYNLALTGRPALLAAVNIDESALNLLADLATLPEGWFSFCVNKTAGADVRRLADLGLVFLSWPGGKIHLSDAGRFLLSLSASEGKL